MIHLKINLSNDHIKDIGGPMRLGYYAGFSRSEAGGCSYSSIRYSSTSTSTSTRSWASFFSRPFRAGVAVVRVILGVVGYDVYLALWFEFTSVLIAALLV